MTVGSGNVISISFGIVAVSVMLEELVISESSSLRSTSLGSIVLESDEEDETEVSSLYRDTN